jgi:all-trans-retinol 13,14-reductase
MSERARSADYDYVVIGAGMGGLTVASLLCQAGARVAVIEAHEYPGGCCHTFAKGDYRFCAAVHYIFSCGEGEAVYNFLRKLGLHESITFERLDPEGYDRFSCPSAGLSFRIPNGLVKWCERLCDQYPAHARGIRTFFDIVHTVSVELRRLPDTRSTLGMVKAAVAAPHVLRHRRHTLGHLFERCKLPAAVRAILGTQLGDVGLPPGQVSFLIYCALVSSYAAGAYYPTEHFSGFIDAVAGVIEGSPGSALVCDAEVCAVDMEQGLVRAVVTRDGRRFRGARFICNADPQRFVSLLGERALPDEFLADKLDYRYSVSSFSMYLGVRGLDLREHGFGNWNRWHYPHLDIDLAYVAQHERGDLSDPWLFMSTPGLCSPNSTTSHSPPGEQILEIITTCRFDDFETRLEAGRKEYTKYKVAVRERILEIVDNHYVPGLRKHLAIRVAGTPTTNQRYLWAPRGNIYGSELTPRNVDASRLGATSPIANLFFTGASAALPSIGGTVAGGTRLYTDLTGDSVNPAYDLIAR